MTFQRRQHPASDAAAASRTTPPSLPLVAMAAALAFGLLAFSSPNHGQTNTVSKQGATAEDRTIPARHSDRYGSNSRIER